MKISVVIITKNEAHIIANTLQSLKAVTDDMVIVDSGSTDDTVKIAKQFNAAVIETGWTGYGMTKNKGNAAAKNDWILSLDADEAVDSALKESLGKLNMENENVVYRLNRKNFFCGKHIRFGEWGTNKIIRVFNRNKTKWNTDLVHEQLVLADEVIIKPLKGSLLHYTAYNQKSYEAKTIEYARLSAKKYFAKGEKAGVLKKYFSPVFSFVQNYIFRLGFLDGPEGFIIAKNTARYTFLKYSYLKEMNKNKPA